MIEKPTGYEKWHKDYLDDLRESGDTNMWGAGKYLAREFGLLEREANAYVVYWMKTFGGDNA